MKIFTLSVCSIALSLFANAQQQPKNYQQIVTETMPKVVEWRRDFHKNPELSNREFKTQEKVYNYLLSLGLEVRKLAKTGVVAILKTNKLNKF